MASSAVIVENLLENTWQAAEVQYKKQVVEHPVMLLQEERHTVNVVPSSAADVVAAAVAVAGAVLGAVAPAVGACEVDGGVHQEAQFHPSCLLPELKV